MTPAQAATVFAELQGSPGALKALIAQIDPAKLEQARVQLFLTDITAWSALADFLGQSTPMKPFANWRAAARARLAAKIKRDGYSPEALAEAQHLMREASSQ